MPFVVDTERMRVAASYFSIVPRTLNVVEEGGVNWTAANDPLDVPVDIDERTAAKSSTERRGTMFRWVIKGHARAHRWATIR